jgi:hypothetical protein
VLKIFRCWVPGYRFALAGPGFVVLRCIHDSSLLIVEEYRVPDWSLLQYMTALGPAAYPART